MYRRLLSLTALTAALCSFSALAADQPPTAPTLDTLAQIVAFARAHAWGPLAALVIGAIVWASKTDLAARLTGKLPAKYRSLVALTLGVLAGILDQVTHGGAWSVAIGAGLTSASAAQMGHVLFIEILRGGREFGQPKPAGASSATTAAAMVIISFALAGCPAFWAALSKVEAGLPVLITAIEGADKAEADYAAAHPDDPAAKAAAEKLKAAEDAAKALADGTKAVHTAGSGDVSGLVAAAISAYQDAKDAVDGLGLKVGEARAESKLVPVADVSAALGAK